MDRGQKRRPHRPQGLLERARALETLMKRKGWTQSRLAEHLGVSRAAVSQALVPLRLDPRVRDAVVAKQAEGWTTTQVALRRLCQMEPAAALRQLATG